MLGEVTFFDGDAGLGEVRSDDGATYGFHCTEIADGSRAIEPGTAVQFRVAAGHLGRREARRLVPLGPAKPA